MDAVRILNIKLKLARSNSTIISRIRANDCLFHQGQHTFSRDYSKVEIPQLRMVNPYGKYVTQGFSPDSSLRARGPQGPAAALKG
jgi:hypothetical protein